MSSAAGRPSWDNDAEEESDNDFNPGQEVASDNEDNDTKDQRQTAKSRTSSGAHEDDEEADIETSEAQRSPQRRITPARNGDDGDDDDANEDGDVGTIDASRVPTRNGATAVDNEEADDVDTTEAVARDENAGDASAEEDEGGEDDDEDEDEEEDEEDEVRGHRRKRHKRDRRNQFIDVEAEVDEEDEEVDEEDEELPEGFVADTHPDDEGLPAGDDVDDRRHRELDRRRQAEENLNAEEQAALFKERYGRNRAAPVDAVVLPQRLLLPSVDDPTIWGVRCKPGKEREIVFAITKRIEERFTSVQPLAITAAFERGGTMAGFVYVEARKQADVLNAVDGITNCYPRTKMVLVPIGEMPDLLRTRKTKTLEPGMYVRIKRGKYQGDLAQVDGVESNGLEVDVRLIPREDYGLLDDANAPMISAAPVGPGEKRKRQNNLGKSVLASRPPQRLFSEVDAKKKHSRHLQQVSSYNKKSFTYYGNQYINGFLIKNFKIQHLQTEDVNPTLEEVTKFTAGAEDGTENLDLAALAATLKASNAADNYLPGDMVEIYHGEQRGICGKAVTVHGDIVTLMVTEGGTRGQRIEAPVKTLRKRFREGDHVKVIGGSKYQDEVGMVVRIKDDRVTLLSDANNQEITVFSKDLRAATDSGVAASGSKYDLYDLVQLDPATVACVIKVDRESLRVLDQNGSIRTILPSSVSNKLERRKFAVATDREGTEIRNDDTVKEAGGEQRQGQVLHIHRTYLFLRNRQQTENAGLFVTRNSSVITVAAKGGRINGVGPDLTKMNPSRNNANGAAAAAMPPPKTMGRDRLIGKTCTIRKGPYKGLLGIIKDTTDLEARIELHTKNKVINVSKEVLTIKDPITGQSIDATKFGGGRGGFGGGGRFGGATPGRNESAWDGGRTPMMGGGKAPMWSNNASGSRTPGWKQSSGNAAGGGRTPAPGWADGSRTVNPWADGSRTSYGGATSYGGSTWNPSAATPFHSAFSGSRTPAAWEAHGRTPAHQGYDAPTPGFSAATPGAELNNHPTPRGANPYGTYNTPAAPTPGVFTADTPAPYGSAQTPGVIGDDEGYE